MNRAFAALSDPIRFQIVGRLSVNEHAVGELALVLGLSQPTTSKALRILRDADLVRVRRVGQLRNYSLRNDRFVDIGRWALAMAHDNTRLDKADG
jgi:DNA-binding transcriptional ArsR family regulator